MTDHNHHGHRDHHNQHEPADAFDRALAEANQSIVPPRRLEARVSRAIGRSIAIRRVGAGSGLALLVLVAGVAVQAMLSPSTTPTPGTVAPGAPDEMVAATGSNGQPPESIDANASDVNTSDAHTPIQPASTIVFSPPDSKYFAQTLPTSKPNVSIVRLYRDFTMHDAHDDTDPPAEKPTDPPDRPVGDQFHEKTHEKTREIDDPPQTPGSAGPSTQRNEPTTRSQV